MEAEPCRCKFRILPGPHHILYVREDELSCILRVVLWTPTCFFGKTKKQGNFLLFSGVLR